MFSSSGPFSLSHPTPTTAHTPPRPEHGGRASTAPLHRPLAPTTRPPAYTLRPASTRPARSCHARAPACPDGAGGAARVRLPLATRGWPAPAAVSGPAPRSAAPSHPGWWPASAAARPSPRSPSPSPSPAPPPPAPTAAAVCWDAVHVGQMPLVGLEAVAALLPGPLGGAVRLHSFVALGCTAAPEQCLVLDFLPEKPTDPATALALASGGSVQGELRVRRMGGWIRGPAIRTRLVTVLDRPLGQAEVEHLVAAINGDWDLRLRLLSNDCRHYAAALLGRLTGRAYGPGDL